MRLSRTNHPMQPPAPSRLQRLRRPTPGRWLLVLLPVTFLLVAASLASGLPTFARLANLPAGVSWSGFSPADWVTALPVDSQITAEAGPGLDPGTAAYASSTDAGASWSDWSSAGLSVSGTVSTTQTLKVVGLNLPDAAGANLIRFRIQEISGTLELSPDFAIRVDTAAPASTVGQPADGVVLRTAPAIAGTAFDATSGVSQVKLSIRAGASGHYWDGSAWVSGEQWLPATGTTSWTYAGVAPVWTDGETYTIRSQASDSAGNVEAPAAGSSFTFDVTAPAVTVVSPNGGEVWAGGQSYPINWVATDGVGLVSTPITLSVSYDGGATWTLLAAAQANSGSTAWTTPAINNTQVLVRVEAVDRAGNVGSDSSDATFSLDDAPPTAPQNLTAIPAGWTKVNDFSVAWTNPPDIGDVIGAWYKLDLPPAAVDDGTFVTTTNVISGISLDVDGAHPIYVWLEDALGRADHTATAATTLHLDRMAPAPPGSLVGTPYRTWTNVNSFSETWVNPPDLSGIKGAYYRLNRPGDFPADGTFMTTTNTLAGIAVPADGKHSLYIWLVDGAGNFSHLNRNVHPDVFWYDSTAPTATVALAPLLPANGWYSTTVVATFSGSDPVGGSGLAAVYHQLDGSAWITTTTRTITAEGPHQLVYSARDVAGNQSNSEAITFSLDLTPPTVSLTPERLPAASGWYTASIAFRLDATDLLSGGALGYYRLNGGSWQTATTFTLTTEGVYLIEYYGQDAAGNRSAVGSLQVRVDATPPKTAYLIEGEQGENGWYTSPLTVTLVPNDNGSGVVATYYQINNGPRLSGTQFQLAADGIYTLLFYSEDAAANVESSFPVQVKVDSTAPGAPTAVSTIPADWSRVNRFSIQWASPTDLSGIVGVYTRMDREPAGDDDGIFAPVTNRLDDLTVPAEGAHHVYLWLRDGAGNADYRNRVLAPPLRYDATPPVTTASVQGLVGTEGWYRGPVTVTLSAADAASGVARLRYRLNGADWVVTTQTSVLISITASDKHVLVYGSEDVAGNVESIHEIILRIDAVPPSAPLNLRAEPSGWQRQNSFRLTWRSPLDQSGIAGAYVRFDTAPTHPADGTFYSAIDVLEGVQAPSEGRHSVYLWLRDKAGNADHTTAVAVADALWYDGTPPVTTVTRTGTLGSNGWYVGPVTFTFSAVDVGIADAVSGVAETRYQIDDAPWTVGNGLSLTEDGVHTVRVASVDNAGNSEATQIFDVALDQRAPIARLGTLNRYQSATSFDVSWSGWDPTPGSGLAGFDVQMRDGYAGTWQPWRSGVLVTSATFTGERGHTYFFRIAARDVAGNLQPFTTDPVFANIETVLNGSFDTGTFATWSASGLLYKAVVPLPGPSGATVLMARLGSEDYGPSLKDPGQVPVGSATISQTLRIPELSQAPRPTLIFWYRVFSYDVVYSQRLQRYVDTFDVTLLDATGQEIALLLRDGNPTSSYGTLYDTGWKRAFIDLSPYAGQTVQLTFANYNRHDNLFNTWSYVDDIQVRDWPYSHRIYLPVILGDAQGAAAAAAAAAPEAEPSLFEADPDGKR